MRNRMDSRDILFALEEKKRWEQRQSQLEEKINSIQEKKAMVQRDLKRVKQLISMYEGIILSLGEEMKTPQDSMVSSTKLHQTR